MKVLRSKWILGTGITLAVFLLLAAQTEKSAHAEIIIEASPDLVWSVLMDEKSYPDWNNVLFPATGKIKEGNVLDYKLITPAGEEIDIDMKVKALIPRKLLNQQGGVPGVFTYNHRYILHEKGKNTRVVIHEDFRGIGVLFIDLTWLQPAYAELNHSLREYVLEMK